jgi:hypothetical protein
MAVIYGGMVGPTTHGIDTSIWNSWDTQTQELYLQDYNRTPEQQNYVDTKSDWYNVAYAYTGIIDHYFGTEAVETGEWVNDEFVPAVKDAGKDLVLAGLTLGGLYLIFKE